jgi:hypothetical protein
MNNIQKILSSTFMMLILCTMVVATIVEISSGSQTVDYTNGNSCGISDKLTQKQVLYPHYWPEFFSYQCIRSQNLNYTLKMETNGNLVLYKTKNMKVLWSTGTTKLPNNAVIEDIWFDPSGELRLDYFIATGERHPISIYKIVKMGRNFPTIPGTYLQLQNNGNLVLYSASNKILWSTNTGR